MQIPFLEKCNSYNIKQREVDKGHFGEIPLLYYTVKTKYDKTWDVRTQCRRTIPLSIKISFYSRQNVGLIYLSSSSL